MTVQTVWQQPKRPRAKAVLVNVDAIKIESTPYPRVIRSTPSKYDSLLDKLKPGQCLTCDPEKTQSVGFAIKKYYLRRNMNAIIRSISRCEDGKGRVWLVRADPIVERKAA